MRVFMILSHSKYFICVTVSALINLKYLSLVTMKLRLNT